MLREVNRLAIMWKRRSLQRHHQCCAVVRPASRDRMSGGQLECDGRYSPLDTGPCPEAARRGISDGIGHRIAVVRAHRIRERLGGSVEVVALATAADRMDGHDPHRPVVGDQFDDDAGLRFARRRWTAIHPTSLRPGLPVLGRKVAVEIDEVCISTAPSVHTVRIDSRYDDPPRINSQGGIGSKKINQELRQPDAFRLISVKSAQDEGCPPVRPGPDEGPNLATLDRLSQSNQQDSNFAGIRRRAEWSTPALPIRRLHGRKRYRGWAHNTTVKRQPFHPASGDFAAGQRAKWFDVTDALPRPPSPQTATRKSTRADEPDPAAFE